MTAKHYRDTAKWWADDAMRVADADNWSATRDGVVAYRVGLAQVYATLAVSAAISEADGVRGE